MNEGGTYSIPDLLKHLLAEPDGRVRLTVGFPPRLKIKGDDHEVDGPSLTHEDMETLIRSIASTRQIRIFRKQGTIEFFHTFQDTRFLVRAVQAFGDFRLDLHSLE